MKTLETRVIKQKIALILLTTFTGLDLLSLTGTVINLEYVYLNNKKKTH